MSASPSSAPASLRGVSFCVVGMSYAPEPTGIAPYTAGLAEMLVEHGARVEVVAGVPHYPSWQVDPAYRWRLRADERRNGVDLRRVRHFVPGRQTALSRLAWEATFLVNGGLVRLHRRPDAVIGVTPSLSGALVAGQVARRASAPLAVLVQDLVGQAAAQSGITGGSHVASAAGRLEGHALRKADRVVVVSDSFRRQVEDYGVPDAIVRLLPNWTHVAPGSGDREQVRRELGWGDRFVVLHTGNMGLKQGLLNVVEAARALPSDSEVLVVLMGDGSQREALQEAGEGVPHLRFAGPVPGERYADVLAAADLLLVNELPTVGEMSLPSKLTSYFSAGRPVLAAVSADGACARELESTGGAAVRVEPDDPPALAAAMQAMACAPEQREAMGRAGARYADASLGRGAASARVLELAHDLLAVRRPVVPVTT